MLFQQPVAYSMFEYRNTSTVLIFEQGSPIISKNELLATRLLTKEKINQLATRALVQAGGDTSYFVFSASDGVQSLLISLS
jgi:hypothetical protein